MIVVVANFSMFTGVGFAEDSRPKNVMLATQTATNALLACITEDYACEVDITYEVFEGTKL